MELTIADLRSRASTAHADVHKTKTLFIAANVHAAIESYQSPDVLEAASRCERGGDETTTRCVGDVERLRDELAASNSVIAAMTTEFSTMKQALLTAEAAVADIEAVFQGDAAAALTVSIAELNRVQQSLAQSQSDNVRMCRC